MRTQCRQEQLNRKKTSNLQTQFESALNDLASLWSEQIPPEADVNTVDATKPAGVITLRGSQTPHLRSITTLVQPSGFKPPLMQVLPAETTTDRMVLGELQAWVQSVSRRVWQRIHAEGAKLRVGVTFQIFCQIWRHCDKQILHTCLRFRLILSYLPYFSSFIVYKEILRCS